MPPTPHSPTIIPIGDPLLRTSPPMACRHAHAAHPCWWWRGFATNGWMHLVQWKCDPTGTNLPISWRQTEPHQTPTMHPIHQKVMEAHPTDGAWPPCCPWLHSFVPTHPILPTGLALSKAMIAHAHAWVATCQMSTAGPGHGINGQHSGSHTTKWPFIPPSNPQPWMMLPTLQSPPPPIICIQGSGLGQCSPSIHLGNLRASLSQRRGRDAV